MAFNGEDLRIIYDRTTGYCHICQKKLAFKNYGNFVKRGAWEVEHSRARANGGSNRLNNLYAACITCNRSKGTTTTRTVRSHHGLTKAPMSKKKRKTAKTENAIAGGAVGALIGSIGGPIGALAGALIGAHIGHKDNPDKLE